jgi:hypothetical protein
MIVVSDTTPLNYLVLIDAIHKNAARGLSPLGDRGMAALE